MANLNHHGVKHLITKIFNAIQDVKNTIPEQMVNVTYSELKSLRDSNKLIPGCEYRITDYVTTTTQENTISAGHKFDIIVTADNENTLNEKVRAINHPSIIEGAIKVKVVEENTSYIYVRTQEFDSNDMYAWAYVSYSDNKDVCFVDLEDYDTADLIFTNTLTPNIGDILDMGGTDVELVSIHYDVNYFLTCNLAAWELWYCLDNDKSRFDWADEENGTGVIYRMIDEWGNDCPYDFKNIMFERGLYDNGSGISKDGDEDFFTYCYTFSWEESRDVIVDASIYGNNGLMDDNNDIVGVYENKIGVYNNSGLRHLNNIVLFSSYGYDAGYFRGYCSNIFGEHCCDNSFNDGFINNRFGNNCCYNKSYERLYNNTFGDNCYSNTFEGDCMCQSNNNIFGNYCSNNKFYGDFYNNTLGGSCYSNKFGYGCGYNTIGNNCSSNEFGYGCECNIFGNNCNWNKFGDYCSHNTFGNDCRNNTFGNNCYSNTFGGNCSYNTFGNNCSYNTFGNKCSNNKFGSSSDTKSYYRYIIFDNGNSYIRLYCKETTGTSKYYQNVRIGLGVNNTSTYKDISDGNVNQSYETLYKPADSQAILI